MVLPDSQKPSPNRFDGYSSSGVQGGRQIVFISENLRMQKTDFIMTAKVMQGRESRFAIGESYR